MKILSSSKAPRSNPNGLGADFKRKHMKKTQNNKRKPPEGLSFHLKDWLEVLYWLLMLR